MAEDNLYADPEPSLDTGKNQTKDMWYRSATEQGDAAAQFELAGMYSRGPGVKEDKIRALMWIIVSASQGFKKAEEIRVKVEDEITIGDVLAAQDLAMKSTAKDF